MSSQPNTWWRRHQDTHADAVSGISALDALYRAARAQFDDDPDFADRARSRVVGL